MHDHLGHIKQLIFIRHGEKAAPLSDGSDVNLAPQGEFRADNLKWVFGDGNVPPAPSYNTPNIIYAMKQKDDMSSNRPFLTIKPLAERTLRMQPIMGERNGDHGDRVFDNRFYETDHAGLYKDLTEQPDYGGKIILFCWEHKEIHKLVRHFKLTEDDLLWGADPQGATQQAQDLSRANYTAIWVFNPGEEKDSPDYFKVYKEFEANPNLVNPANGLWEPDGENVVYQRDPIRGPYLE